jgi:phasin family protein
VREADVASERNGQARSAGGARQVKASRDIAASAARAAAISMGTTPAAEPVLEALPALPVTADALPIPMDEFAAEVAPDAAEVAPDAAEVAPDAAEIAPEVTAGDGAEDVAGTAGEAGELASRSVDEIMNETMDEAVSEAEAVMAEPVSRAVESVRTTATTTMERAMTTAEDFMAFGQGNIEALVKAGQIWAAGLQDIGKTVADSAQAQIEQNVSAFKALTGVKSLREAVDLQSTHARAALEKVVADSGKLTDASMKLAEQALAPITARMSIAAERFGRAA